MLRKVSMLILATALAATTAFAGSVDRKDLQVFNDISSAVNRYALFTIFDDVSANVENGNVTLTGKVTQPYKRDEIEKRVTLYRERTGRVPGSFSGLVREGMLSGIPAGPDGLPYQIDRDGKVKLHPRSKVRVEQKG